MQNNCVQSQNPYKIRIDSRSTPSLRGFTFYSFTIVNGDFVFSLSLAEGDKGGGLKAQKNSSAQFSNNESTHPLTPSAREGESVNFFANSLNDKRIRFTQI